MVPSIEQEIRDLHELLGSARDPDARAFVPLADAYRRAGDPDRALELLVRGRERHPELAAAHLVEAWTRRELGDEVGAEDAFRRVLDRDPDNARALVGLGRLLVGADDVVRRAEGETLLERGQALDPRAWEAEPAGGGGASGTVEADWDVVDAADLAPSVEESDPPGPEGSGDEVVIEIAALAPEGHGDELDLGAVAPPGGYRAVGGGVVEDSSGAGPTDTGPSPLDPLDAPLPEAGEAGVAEDAIAPDGGLPDPGAPRDGHDDGLVDLADLAPTGASDEFVVSADAAAEPPTTDDEDDEPSADGDSEWFGGSLDIQWEGAGFYDRSGTEAAGEGGDRGDDELRDPAGDPDGAADVRTAHAIDDAAGFEVFDELEELEDFDEFEEFGERTGASSAEEPPVGGDPSEVAGSPPEAADGADEPSDTPDRPGEEVLMDLADLAPDIEPAAPPAEGGQSDEVLPTRTLGELYARQGLTAQAIRVYRALIEARPDDDTLRRRLAELEADRTDPAAVDDSSADRAPPELGAGPEDAVPAPGSTGEVDRGTGDGAGVPISTFLTELLRWAPDPPEESDGSPGR